MVNYTDDVALKILAKMAKQRRESAQIYSEQNRPDLAEPELAEAAVIESYLPQPRSAMPSSKRPSKPSWPKMGATSVKEMGKVMGVASKKLAGKADGKAISEKVKALLA